MSGDLPLFTYHLVETSPLTTVRAVLGGLSPETTPGLRHAECMWAMELGAGIVSPKRMQLRDLAVFASWDSEQAVDEALSAEGLGRTLAGGWHVRLDFLRRWGKISEFDGLPPEADVVAEDHPVVAVTLARLKYPQIPRFIRWGRPVERLVRDHPGITLALASMHPTRTVSTFSVWRTQREMEDMVRGHSAVPEPDRHSRAMVERERKDFHFEFTTLRFRTRSEHGAWKGRTGIVPEAATAP